MRARPSQVGRQWRRVPRWLRIVLYTVAGAFLLYVVAANVVLKTRLLRTWLSTNESTLKVEYSSAWSGYPGHVAVRDLSFRYQDSNIQMLIELERATLRFDPFALSRRAVRMSKLTAEGTTFRLRQKVESLEGNEGRVAAFPPIEGYADPPIEKKVPKPPIPDEQYDLWTIELADVAATVRELWTMEYRYRGEGTLSGGFRLQPQREVWILPSVMLTKGGVVSLGDRALVRGGEGRVEAQMDAFDPRESKGVEVLRHLTARVQQHGELASLGAISATYFAQGSPVEIDQGAGPIAVDVDVMHGVVQPTSRVTFHTADAVVKVPPVTLRSDARAVVRVDTSGERPAIVAELTVDRAALTPAADLRGVHVLLDSGNADLGAPFAIARLMSSFTSFHASDLRAWQPIAPGDMTFEGGSAAVAASVDYRRGVLDGRFDLKVAKGRMKVGPFSMAFSGSASSNLASQDASRAVAFPGAALDLKDISLRLQSGHASGLWLRARLDEAKATIGGAIGFDSRIGVQSGPGREVAALFTRMAPLPDIVAKATAGTQLDASLHLHVGPRVLTLAILRANNGALEARGRLTKKKATPLAGAFLISVPVARVGLELHDGTTSVRPFVGRDWLEPKLSGRR